MSAQEPQEEEETWVPYEGDRGGTGWQSQDDPDKKVYQDEPPGAVETEPLEENPMSVGDVVRLEYDDEVHYGEVLWERYPDESGGDVRVQDDRNNWNLEADETEQYGGDMTITNCGQRVSDKVDPSEMEVDDPDDLAYVIGEMDMIEDAAEEVISRMGEVDEDVIVEGVRESGYSLALMGDELLRQFCRKEVDGHEVAPSADFDGAEALREEFKEKNPEAGETMVRASRGWEGSMYAAKNAAPMIQAAMEETGNETMPEYDQSDRAASAGVDDEKIEHMKESSEWTTEKLREAYGDEITVMRGFSDNPHGGTRSEGTELVDELKDANIADDEVAIEHRPLESWTLEPNTAKLYATGGAVVKTTIPVEDVMASSSVGTIHPSENDTVVQHEGEQVYDADDIYSADELSEDEMLFRLRMAAAEGMQKGSGGESSKSVSKEADRVIPAELNQAQWIRGIEPNERDDEDELAESIVEAAVSVVKSETPEGVPEGAEYVSPEEAESLPDEEVVVSDSGGHYRVGSGGSEGSEGESSGSEFGVSEGDSYRDIDSPEDAAEALEQFDAIESGYSHDQWSGPSADVSEGSYVRLQDGDFQLEGDGDEGSLGVVVEDGDELVAVDENGNRVDIVDDYMMADEGESRILAVWDDAVNQAVNGERDISSWDESDIADQHSALLGDEDDGDGDDGQSEDSSWFDEFDPDEEFEEAVVGSLGRGVYEIDGETVELEPTESPGDIDHYRDENSGVDYAEVDGIAMRANTKAPETDETQYIEWSDESDMDDGWYQVGGIVEGDDGVARMEFTDESGETVETEPIREDEALASYTPVDSAQSTGTEYGAMWEAYDSGYPDNPEFPDDVDTSEVESDVFNDRQTEGVKKALAKAEEMGITGRVEAVRDLNEETATEDFDPDNTMGRYLPDEKEVLINTDAITEEKLESLSDDFGVGDSIEDMVLHEIMHGEHADQLLEDGWSLDEIEEKLLESDLDPSEQEFLEEEVSRYAASNPLEVVAEVGLAISKGEEISDEVLYIYEKYGGMSL